jgi:LPS-assembly lipoprotein
MLSLRKIFILVTVLSLTACGFAPVHQRYGGKVFGAEGDLAAIKLGNIGDQKERTDQVLKTNLGRELNLSSINAKKKYILNITLTDSIAGLGVKKDKEITRYNIIFTANYTLQDIETKEEVTRGRSKIVGGYDAVASDFGTYAAKKDVEGRIMNELAKDIKLRLTSYFLRN